MCKQGVQLSYTVYPPYRLFHSSIELIFTSVPFLHETLHDVPLLSWLKLARKQQNNTMHYPTGVAARSALIGAKVQRTTAGVGRIPGGGTESGTRARDREKWERE